MEQAEEKHDKKCENAEEKNNEMKQNKKKDIEKVEEELKKAQEEAYDWKNKYYMELADVQNLRKSLEEDHRNALRYRSEGFLENLLPALDGFYLALNGKVETQEAKNYQQGFIYIYNQIQNALSSEGVNEILPKIGDEFDAHSMNAIDIEEGDESNDGKVAHIYSKGYKLHDKLIRPANVKVYKKKVETKKEDNQTDQNNIEEANKA